MKVLIQRSLAASVSVDQNIVGQIERGLVLLVGIEKHDTRDSLERMADKVVAYRVFTDDQGKMNLNIQQVNGAILAVSQFTLAASTNKGLRPSFSSAAPPANALTQFNQFVSFLKARIAHVETGEFGANMQVKLINDGPVTFLLEN